MKRPIRSAHALGVVLACALLASCSEQSQTPLTQIVVVVDSDFSGLTRFEAEIRGFEDPESVTAELEDSPLPRRFTLVHDGGPLGPIDVIVRAYVDDCLKGAEGPLIADAGNHAIRRLNLAGAAVETLAGDGSTGTFDATGDSARFSSPVGVGLDAGGTVYVADKGNHRIRVVTAAGVVTTLAGDVAGSIEGPTTSARFQDPSDVAVAANGTIYVSDTGNHRIRVIKAP